MAKESTQTDPGIGPGSSKKGTDPGLGNPPVAPVAEVVAAAPRDPSRDVSRDVSVDTLLTGLLGEGAEPKLVKRSSGEQAIAFAAPAHAVPAAHTDPSAEPPVVLRQSLVDDAEMVGAPAPAVEVWVPGGGTPPNGARRMTPGAGGIVKPAAGAPPAPEPASQPKQRVAHPLILERSGVDEKAPPKRSITPASGGLFLGAAVAPHEPGANLTPTAPPTGAFDPSPETVRSRPRGEPDFSSKATVVTRPKPADRRGWIVLGLLLLLGGVLSGWLILKDRGDAATEPRSPIGTATATTQGAPLAPLAPPSAVNIAPDPTETVQTAPSARPTARKAVASATATAAAVPAPSVTAAATAPASAAAPSSAPLGTSAKGSSGDPAAPPAGFNDLKGEIRK